MTAKKTPKKGDGKVYRTTGKELPIRVDLPTGGHLTYEKKGQEFSGDEWPMPHITILNQLAHGTIEEVV